ncbi:membrane-associated phospholipid phosphatase [Angulomicrobium tetraedrale]|uniref:Membrane-associated phospholipid phosphatase n=1 Tax=Ancylobacter tetraedralis TaxID=217068 RepID=A0A839ZCH5_9HYPH|nr:phosphatase PAP2 family protein [Ancylobacter tetraedralis]MBB3772382.1 membrane-associated phospholipid phosphatase [Ancylobacter tetraedralis]
MERTIHLRTYERLKNYPITSFCLLTAVLSLLFYAVPEIDKGFTHLFYEPGIGFPAAKKSALIDFRNLASNLSIALPITLVLALGLKLLYPSKPCLCSPRMSLYFISLFLIGPSLIVNGALKSFWGRPRPVSVIDFGGVWPFSEAWVIADHGWFNRSFSSGEAATVACLLPLALFVPRAWRVQVVTLVGLLVAATSLNRIAFGAHFLSDVTISIGIVLVVAAVLHRIFFVTHAEALSDEALERRLTRIGRDWAGRRAALRARSGRMVTDGVNALARFGRAQLRRARAAAAMASAFIAARREVGRRTPLSPQ